MNKPDVSIIIPVYNDEEYLRACLDSARNQTLSNIEIVCVDDGSTDGTAGILSECRQQDSRVVVLHHEKNMGTLMARKTGVKAASGEYIIFLDGDDLLAPECCEIALRHIREQKVDILWFSIEIREYSNGRALTSSEWHPRPELLSGVVQTPKSLIPEKNRSLLLSLWGKMYTSEVVKRAHDEMDDFYGVYGEDIYESFFLLFYAKSISGIKTQPLLIYRRGLGICGNDHADLSVYRKFCGMSELSRRIRFFLERKGIWEENKVFWQSISIRMVVDCCIEFYRLLPEDYAAGKEMLSDAWDGILPLGDVIGPMAEEFAVQKRCFQELERAKAWLLSQLEGRDARIQELESWTGELEKGKAWLEEHSRAAEEALKQEQARSAQLEAKLRRLLDDKVIRGIVKLRHYDV